MTRTEAFLKAVKLCQDKLPMAIVTLRELIDLATFIEADPIES